MTRLSGDLRFLKVGRGSEAAASWMVRKITMIKRLLTMCVIGAIGATLVAAATLTAPKLAAPGARGPAAAPCPNLTGAPPVSPGGIRNEVNGVTVVSACRAWLVGEYG